MATRLTAAEIHRRLATLRNYERLEPQRREQMAALKRRVRELEREILGQRREYESRIQRLELRLEQLTTMVFGQKNGGHEEQPPQEPDKKPEKQPRTSASFRRKSPEFAEITAHAHFPINRCPDCHIPLARKETVTRFVEDIPLPKKTVEEQRIERGTCPRCGKVVSGKDISPQISMVGQNVRLFILFAITVLGQTFEKVKTHLQAVHGLSISDGEITAILHEGHRRLLPAKTQIEEALRETPVSHYDETGSPVQDGAQGNFAWIKTRPDGPETLFLLGRTRGKGNAEEIRGPPSDQIAVTDDYGAYDHLFTHHQLCWAHPRRKFRDLARSAVLTARQRKRCQETYESFRSLQDEIALFLEKLPLDGEREQANERCAQRLAAIAQVRHGDPPKLRTLKETLQANVEKYLLCVHVPGVPMTNNQAERRLRHLVIKRLLSFGNRTQKGAETMGTLLSVLLTLWWKKPEDYFGELRKLLALSAA